MKLPLSPSLRRFLPLAAALAVAWGVAPAALAQNGFDYPDGRKPEAVIDLATAAGAALVQGQWRYSDTKIIETDFKDAAGHPNKTYDYTPHAGAAAFDDSAWEILAPESLVKPRSTGKLCFAWYRINVTIPEKVGDTSTAGATVVFQVTIDDYAEVWIDGKLPRKVGQTGGSVVRGFNAPNRLAITTDAKPGQKIQIAVFGINGPISDTPENWIFVRNARLEFDHPQGQGAAASQTAPHGPPVPFMR